MQHVTVTLHFTYLICLSQLFKDVSVIVMPILPMRKIDPGSMVPCPRGQEVWERQTWHVVKTLDFTVHTRGATFLCIRLPAAYSASLEINQSKEGQPVESHVHGDPFTRSISVGMTITLSRWTDLWSWDPCRLNPCLVHLLLLTPKPKPPDSQTRASPQSQFYKIWNIIQTCRKSWWRL